MRRYEEAIADASTRRMSAGTLLETYIVLEMRDAPAGVEQLDALLERASIEVVPVTVDHVHVAHRGVPKIWKRQTPSST